MDARIINGKTYVKFKGSWIPVDEYINIQKASVKPTLYTRDAVEQLIEENAYLTKKVDTLQNNLKQAAFTNSNLYSEVDKCKRALRELANGGAVTIDKNGNVKFPDIGTIHEQHKDNTPDQMVETFAGIYEVWEKHPEFELMELISKLINNKRGNVPLDDEEFIKALKEAFNV